MSNSFKEDWPKSGVLLGTILGLGLLGVLIIILFGGAAPPSREIALCSDEPGINEKINEMAFQALDEALKEQIGRLFTTWMKDDSGQPARAAVGVKQAAYAYVHARQAILDWNIPPCKGG